VNAFDRLCSLADAEEDIVGLVLSGSRGRGTELPDSDWDCFVIVADAAGTSTTASLNALSDASLDLAVIPSSRFDGYAAPGSEEEWAAYAFVHTTIVRDDEKGSIAERAAAKEFLEPAVAAAIASSRLDGYINSTERAAKSRRAGSAECSLDASESIAPALEALFAFEHRIRPYNRYLEWELEHHPLDQAIPPAAEFVALLVATAAGDAHASATLFGIIERCARASGSSDVVDAWDRPALSLVRG
jgi:hypothetical protein